MSFGAGRAQLFAAFKDIAARWETVKPHWQDSARRQFEEQFWKELEPTVKAALTAMDRLSQAALRVRQECD